MKIYSFTSKLCLLFVIVLLTACAGETKKDTEKATAPEVLEEVAETQKESNTYYAWVDNINVRDASNTKGKVIGTYSSEDALEFTGTKSNEKEIIVLRGIAYDDYWLKVTTKDGKEGWVYGGAVVLEGGDKGNEIITKDKFNFSHFGEFNLSSWSDLGVTKSAGGDAETSTHSYMKDGKILEVEKTEVGEYGYHNTYKLMNAKRKLLKERIFSFTVDVGEAERILELTETVKDYTTKKQFTRSQKVNKHFMAMNAKPQMVNGTWNETTLDNNKSTTSAKDATNIAFAKPLQIITSVTDLPNGFDNGCDCSFRTHPKDYDTMILLGTYEDAPKAKAVIKIAGKYVILNSKTPENPDHKNGDVHKHFYNDTYDLKLTLTKDGQDDGSGQQYSGTMHLTSKDGTVNTNINTFGGCGC